MIKQSNLLKWNQNNKNASKGNRTWVHPPEALQQGHVAYLVKFLGNIEVDQAKGIDVIKEGIRKLKFNQQLKKAEGTKTPKVEVTISIDGVAIQDPKTKQISHQYPLHRISYCANDKSDKKFFSFIAKEDTNDRHRCFVFASDRLAEDITLTIGEAFDLAYRRFLDTSGKDLENKKQLMILQKRVQELEKENAHLRKRISELDSSEIQLMKFNGSDHKVHTGSTLNSQTTVQSSIPPVPPRSFNNNTASQELLNLVFLPPSKSANLDNLTDQDFNPRGDDIAKKSETNNGTKAGTDAFGAVPFTSAPAPDPFGMGDFSNLSLGDVDFDSAIGELDKMLSQMRDGFSRGITFGKEDFSFDKDTHPPKGQ